MCETKHNFYFCSCKNSHCRARSVRCIDGNHPPTEQVAGKSGHFIAECDWGRDFCSNYVFDFLDPSRSNVPVPACKEDETDDVAVVMGELCEFCKASCAMKQWGKWTSKKGIRERSDLLTKE